MRTRGGRALLLGLLMLGAGWSSAGAGDSLYGRVTEVKSASTVTFDYGDGQYELRIAGIEVSRDSRLAEDARRFVSDLVLGKNVRMRFEGRDADGVMWARLFTDDPTEIKEVGVELVRSGLARGEEGAAAGEGYKYQEMSAAENEARRARRGLWAEVQRQ